MNKRTIITILLAAIAMAGKAQTAKIATIKGYSPTLDNSTVAACFIEICASHPTRFPVDTLPFQFL